MQQQGQQIQDKRPLNKATAIPIKTKINHPSISHFHSSKKQKKKSELNQGKDRVKMVSISIFVIKWSGLQVKDRILSTDTKL